MYICTIMVLYGVDNGSHVYSKSDSIVSDPYLVITTNVINDEILDSVDMLASNTMNIIFQVPLGQDAKTDKDEKDAKADKDVSTRNIHFDFRVTYNKWTIFARRIRFLEFRGMLVDHQFTANHLECMASLEGLYIGSTNYKLFDHEEDARSDDQRSEISVSNLPMIKYLSLNGYGLVYQSPYMETWIKTLTINGCNINMYF